MERLLILDDEQVRHDAFKTKYPECDITHIYTSKEMIKCLEENEYDYVFLDHDLGGQQMVASGPDTGYEVAEWLAAHHCCMPKKGIVLHTLNPVGKVNMQMVLKDAPVQVIPHPGAWL